MTREETSKYSDPLPDCTARLFSFEMDAKSVITFPAFPTVLTPGWWEITGLAWSGRGRIRRVDVSTDGGRMWRQAGLQDPVLPKCHTRFRYLWRWGGEEAWLMSRAVDETGYVQPEWKTLQTVRGRRTRYHLNPITGWRLAPDGEASKPTSRKFPAFVFRQGQIERLRLRLIAFEYGAGCGVTGDGYTFSSIDCDPIVGWRREKNIVGREKRSLCGLNLCRNRGQATSDLVIFNWHRDAPI